MNKRIICLLLAALMLFSVVGCKGDGETTEDVVSYITEYEDVYEEVETEDEETESEEGEEGEEDEEDKTSSNKTSSKKNSSNKKTSNEQTTTTITTTSSQKKESSNKTSSNKTSSNKTSSNKTSSNKTSSDKTSSTTDNKNITSVNELDFGGKTFRKTIIGAIPAVTMRRKAAFEKKYNCKLELVSLQWEQFNSQCATAVASGNPYDICGAQTFFWPEAGVKNLYEPLNDYVLEKDLYNAKTGVGIDLNKSKYFSLKDDKFYAVCNHHGNCADMTSVLYYSKAKFLEAGLDDPLDVYNSGKWTWDYFLNLAKQVKDEAAGEYLFGKDLSVGLWAQMNGYEGVKKVDGKYKTNVEDPKYLKALQYWQENMLDVQGPGGNPSDNYTAILNGTQYMHCQGYQAGTYYMYDGVCNSSVFEKDFNNLGIVPLPMGPDNTDKKYNSSGPQGKAAGKGSANPFVVVAWTKFDLEFKDPTAEDDPTLYSDETYKMIYKLFDNMSFASPNFKTSGQSASDLGSKITAEANKKDGNIAKAIADNKANIQAIIDESMGY